MKETAGQAWPIGLPSGFSLQEDEDFVYLYEGERQVAIFSAYAPAGGLVTGINEYLGSRDVRAPLAHEAGDRLPVAAGARR